MDSRSREMSRTTPGAAARWVFLPFAAVLGGLAGAAVLMFFQWALLQIAGMHSSRFLFRIVLPCAEAMIFGYLYALISFKAAPFGRQAAGLVMVSVLVVVLGLTLFFTWAALENTSGMPRLTLIALVAMITSVATLASIWNTPPPPARRYR